MWGWWSGVAGGPGVACSCPLAKGQGAAAGQPAAATATKHTTGARQHKPHAVHGAAKQQQSQPRTTSHLERAIDKLRSLLFETASAEVHEVAYHVVVLLNYLTSQRGEHSKLSKPDGGSDGASPTKRARHIHSRSTPSLERRPSSYIH